MTVMTQTVFAVIFMFQLLVYYSNAAITFKNCPQQKLSRNHSTVGCAALSSDNSTYTVIFAGDGASNKDSHIDGFHVSSSNIESFTSHDLTNRWNMARTSWQHLIIFAGGTTSDDNAVNKTSLSPRVDIYNTITNKWELKYLSESREFLTAATLGNMNTNDEYVNDEASDVVDIWNHTDNLWSTAKLSLGRKKLASATAGNKILFGGGFSENPPLVSNVVDIYNIDTNKWSTSILSQPRQRLGGASATNNIACFGGGETVNETTATSDASDIIDIYNDDTGKWSVMHLSQSRRNLYGENVANRYCVFAGGVAYVNNTLYQAVMSNKLDVYDGENNEMGSMDLQSGGRAYAGMAGIFSTVMVAGGGGGYIVDVVAINSQCIET